MSGWFARNAARIATFGATLWPKIVFAGGIILALLGVYAVVRKSGRDAERADQATEGIKAIGRANKAEQRLDHSQEAIDNDPNNLDRVR